MKKVTINKLMLMSVALLCTVFIPLSVTAGEFDGSKPLYCALMDTVQCLPGGECQEIEAEEVNLPNFLVIDFKKEKITTTKARGNQRTSKIENKKQVDGKLIVQGAEDGAEGVKDGLGWSIAINDTTGKMVLTGSGDDVGFVFFGACTPQ
jgi:hypothetical protein